MQDPISGTPDRIGRFTVVRVLGQGGMGQVYLARTRAGHEVVVKVIHQHLLGGDDRNLEREYRSRFSREAEAARQVGGLYTAPIVAADPEADPPWIATMYVPGPTLGEAIRARGSFTSDGVRQLAAHLAEGLEAIHDCGLVHRDLKPANIIVSDSGPKIIDFGVARPVEGENLTHTGGILGTPSYMSPEQAHGFQVTPASDVFSLATVLYFAFTGANPFQAPSLPATLMRVVGPPPDLSILPADLAELLTACWRHTPGERPSAEGVLDILGGTGTSAPDARRSLVRPPVPSVAPEPPEARPAMALPTAGDPPARTPAYDPVPGSVEPPANARPPISPSAGRWAGAKEAGGHLPHEDMVSAVSYSPSGEFLATACWDGGVRLWSADSRDLVTRYKGHRGPVYALAFSSDGASIATASADRSVKLWDTFSGRRLGSHAYRGAVTSVVFSPDSQMLAVAEEDRGASLLSLSGAWSAALEGGGTEVNAVAFTADGAVLAAGTRGGDVVLWDVHLGVQLHSFAHPGPVMSVTFSPNGNIAVGCENGSVRLWDLASESDTSETRYLDLLGHEEAVGSVAFSPDGAVLATGGDDHKAVVWDTVSFEPVTELAGHEEAVESVAFSPDGAVLATGGDDGTVRFWCPV
ncbi:WD40 repeat domain-containing serine/threonine protein kinase [Nocardiopsis valliformis]|uniref:WD40 repeat domain-containing serine/threonine protein kinase n=1 Tax=Nocardiopsis valliformis TaxID=239974 RepID=UPI000347ED84|nr:serine/threonine-protein kinase [Nocardiopsis valliformis]